MNQTSDLSAFLPTSPEEQAAMDALIAELEQQVAEGKIKPMAMPEYERMTIPEFFIPLLYRPQYRTRGALPVSASEFCFVYQGGAIKEGEAVKAYYMAQPNIYFWGTERQFIEAQLDQVLLDTYLRDLEGERVMSEEILQRLGTHSKLLMHDQERLWGKRCANLFCPHTVSEESFTPEYFREYNKDKMLPHGPHMRLHAGERMFLPFWMFAPNSTRRVSPDSTSDLCLDCIKALRIQNRAYLLRPSADLAALLEENLIEIPVEFDPNTAPLSPNVYYKRIEMAARYNMSAELRDVFPPVTATPTPVVTIPGMRRPKMSQKFYVPNETSLANKVRQGYSWEETVKAGRAARDPEVRCSRCKEMLPVRCFTPDPKRKGRGCSYYCRRCTSEYQMGIRHGILHLEVDTED